LKDCLERKYLVQGNGSRLIEIAQKMPGFNRFIGSWVYGGPVNFVVDVGPAYSVDRLIGTLTDMGMDRVDYVLLTHIHIDHAGGLARFLDHFPMALAVCHEKGKRHLMDPARLWEGSLKTLGEIAEIYGPPGAVEEERCLAHTEADIKDLTIVETPGHAVHHLAFSLGGNLFSGEAAGNYYRVKNTDYLRPATPPKFFLEVFLKSLDRLMTLEDQHMCYAHFGDAPSSHRMLQRFRAQIFRWKEIIQEEMGADTHDLPDRYVDKLLKTDPELKAFSLMDPETQKRERYFMANSVKGYIGFLRNPDEEKGKAW
jgi:glyoxylase-like metal-dependent hydrolase (beta-lactamase superfamily II)